MKRYLLTLGFLSSLICCVSCVRAAETQNPRLLGSWSFDDANKPLLNSVNDVEASGPSVVVEGKVDRALQLDGHAVVTVADREKRKFDAADSFTVQCFARLAGETRNQRVVGKWGNDAASASYILWFDLDGHPSAVVAADGKLVILKAPNAAQAEQWVHLRLTWDGKDALTLYLDGEQVEQKKGIGTINTPSADLVIGAGPQGTGSLVGLVDEVKFYRGLMLDKPDVKPVPVPGVGSAIAPNDERLTYSDIASVDITPERARFSRLLDADGGFGHDSAGARVRFRTDARVVKARMFYNELHLRNDATSGVGAFLVDGKVSGTFGSADKRSGELEVELQNQLKAAAHDYELLLPYGQSVDFRGLILQGETTVSPLSPRPQTRYIAYGDSITQGFHASGPAQNYPFLVGQSKNWETINFGFGGRPTTAADAQAIAGLKGDIISVAMGYNDQFNRTPEQYGAELKQTLMALRAAQPRVPIYLITLLWSSNPYPTKGFPIDDYRKAARTVYEEIRDANLHLIEGETLVPSDPKLFRDGIHPTDEGFAMMAKNLAPQLKLSP